MLLSRDINWYGSKRAKFYEILLLKIASVCHSWVNTVNKTEIYKIKPYLNTGTKHMGGKKFFPFPENIPEKKGVLLYYELVFVLEITSLLFALIPRPLCDF